MKQRPHFKQCLTFWYWKVGRYVGAKYFCSVPAVYTAPSLQLNWNFYIYTISTVYTVWFLDQMV